MDVYLMNPNGVIDYFSTTTATQNNTYLEFDRVLRIEKASNFSIEFQTTEEDGIVFYIADEINVDFIALLIKDGKVKNRVLDLKENY
jgi:hypothetical protein